MKDKENILAYMTFKCKGTNPTGKKGQRHSKKKTCFCEDIKKAIKKHELSSEFKE